MEAEPSAGPLTDSFVNHGAAVRADEARTAAVCVNREGECRFVIAARGYVLVVDPASGTSEQLPFPDGCFDYPFASYSDGNGMFYTGAGPMFLVCDPFAPRFVFFARPMEEQGIVGFSFAEDAEGRIYTTTYPACRLLRYDPRARSLTELAVLDPEQKYAASLAVSADGWVYAGLGTERRGIAAFDPDSGAVHQLLDSKERTRGSGLVMQGVDGAVYASFPAGDPPAAERWHRMERLRRVPLPEGEAPIGRYSGQGFQRVHRSFPQPWSLEHFSLSEKEVVLRNEATGESKRVPLRYETNGATLSTLTSGPDGRIYGTSHHPLHLYRYDPRTGLLTDFGGRLVERGGGGNIAAYASQGSILAGTAYAGGYLHLIDTSRPFETDSPSTRNPKLVATHPEVYRPRCAAAHPDGEHVIYGGYPGYGAVGGGLCIYNLATGRDELIANEALLPFHSTVCMTMLPNGDFFGGTSVLAPGGAMARADEARLYRFDWQGRRIAEHFVPVSGAKSIMVLTRDERHRLHGITDDRRYFVWDAELGRTVHTADVSIWGSVVANGFVQDRNQTIVGVMQHAIFTVDTARLALRLLAVPPKPITAGLTLLDGKLYFGCGSELWAYTKAQGGEPL